jgi:hypothetical protein
MNTTAADMAGRQRQVLATAAPAPAPAPAEPLVLTEAGWPVETWEYDVVTSEVPLPKDRLRTLGRGGWILSSITRGGRPVEWFYYFRRRAQVSAKPTT